MSTEETFAEQVKRVAKTCKQSKRRIVAELLESNRIISLDTRQIITLGNEVDGLKKRIQELEAYITREGEMNGICTFNILNKVCDGCRCERRETK